MRGLAGAIMNPPGYALHMRARLLLLAAGSSTLAACDGGPAGDAPFPADAPSVLVVTIDTTRADRLGCYGYEGARTPTLDALAANGARFERAYAHVPLTLPSHATIFSGIHPPGTGLHVNHQGAIHREVPLLAEMYRAAGYRTGAFIAAWVLNSEFGLDRGFQTYDDLEPDPRDSAVQVERPADEVVDAFLAWLEREPGARFFAWVHVFDVHDPYEPPEGYSDLPSPYDGELAFVDAQLGRLLEALDERGLRESTLVVVTADHGEGLGDHGEGTHGLLVYDSTTHVPLILSWPGRIEPRVVGSPVALVDLHPTVVELCGGRPSSLVEGRSLVPALQGQPLDPRPVYSESEYPLRSFGWAPLTALRDEGWKYIQAPDEELYDTARDPGELKDLAEAEPGRARAMREELHQWLGDLSRREAEAIESAPEAAMNLAALGYVEGLTDIEGIGLEDLRDPKEVLEVYKGAMRAKQLSDQGRHEEVIALLVPLLELSPESDEVWSLLARSYLELGRFDEARDAAQKSLRARPDLSGRLVMLGEAYLGLGQPEEALVHLQHAAKLNAEDGSLQSRLGIACARLGKIDEAEAHFRAQVRLEPDSPNAHTNLANALFSRSRFDEGLAELDAALRLDPECKPAWLGRLQVYAATGRPAEGAQALRDALEAVTDRDEAFLTALGRLAVSMGDAEGARQVEERLRAH